MRKDLATEAGSSGGEHQISKPSHRPLWTAAMSKTAGPAHTELAFGQGGGWEKGKQPSNPSRRWDRGHRCSVGREDLLSPGGSERGI